MKVDLDCVAAIAVTAVMVAVQACGADIDTAIITAPLAVVAAIRGIVGLAAVARWRRRNW